MIHINIRCPNCGSHINNHISGQSECTECGCRMTVLSEGKIIRHDLLSWFVFLNVLVIAGAVAFMAKSIYTDSPGTEVMLCVAAYFYANIIHGLQTGSVKVTTSGYYYKHKSPGIFYSVLFYLLFWGHFVWPLLFMTCSSAIYNGNDWLLSETGPAGLTYGYDNNGNTVSRSDGTDTVIYGYDYENRLVSAGSAAYAYDADGIRVGSVTDGSTTDYVTDKNRQYAQVLEERSDAASVSYVHGDDLISRKQGGEVRYYVYDGHGSVRQLTDADGTVTDSYIYDAFGNLRDHLGESDNRYLYAGEQYDADSGLYYLRARYYSKTTP